MGNTIGKTLKVDMNTLAHCQRNDTLLVERGRFARVSVEVDLTKQLRSRFVIRKRIYTVEYEGLHVICFKCGRYGHNRESCTLNNQTKLDQPGDVEDAGKRPVNEGEGKGNQGRFNAPGIPSEEAYGEWMMAKKTFKPKRFNREMEKKQQTVQPSEVNAGAKERKHTVKTRYDVLREESHFVHEDPRRDIITNRGTVSEWRKKDMATDAQNRKKEIEATRKVKGTKSKVIAEGSTVQES